MTQSYKPGQVLQSTVFPSMQAVVTTELQPNLYIWYLARPAKKGSGFVKYGFARFGGIDPLSWTPKS